MDDIIELSDSDDDNMDFSEVKPSLVNNVKKNTCNDIIDLSIDDEFEEQIFASTSKYVPINKKYHDMSDSDDDDDLPRIDICKNKNNGYLNHKTSPPPLPESQNSYKSDHPISDSEEEEKDTASNFAAQTNDIFDNDDDDLFMPTIATSSNNSIAKRKPVDTDDLPNKKTRKKRTTAEKEAELAAKELKKREREEARRLRPEKCLEYTIMELAKSIIDMPELQAILHGPPLKPEVKSRVSSDRIFNTIEWVREKSNGSEENCNHMVQLLEMTFLEPLIKDESFSSHISELMKSLSKNGKISFFIFGSQAYLKTKAVKGEPKKITKAQLDETIALAQIEYGISFKLVETAHEVATWLLKYTKGLAQQPFKLSKQGWQEYFRFHIESEKGKNIGRGIPTNENLPKVWLNMLKKIRRATPEMCNAIVAKYPTPTSLFMAYDECENEEEAKSLLQSISIQKGFGPLAVTRNLGPVLSRKVYTIFNSIDPHKKIAD